MNEFTNGSVMKTYYEDDFPLLMPRWGYVVSAFILFLIGFFGFFLNLLVILLMVKDRQLWTPLNMILFNLVCSDFLVSVLGNPFTLISALFHRWVFGPNMCVLYGFFMALLGITSITTLTVLAFERYMMVCRPLSSCRLTMRGAGVGVALIWCYSLALTTPPLLGWGNYINEAANISCSVNWHEQSTNTLTYILYLFAMGQIIPMAVISFSYINIVRTMKQNSQRLGRVNRAETKVSVMVFLMTIAFTVAWTPYSVFALMEQFATETFISPGVGVIPALVAKSSICYNPIIYAGMNTQFRQSIKRIFGPRRKGSLEKVYDNTLLSLAHRLSRINDTTTRCNVSENISTNNTKKQFKLIIRENKSNIIYNDIEDTKDIGKNNDLITIQEINTVSDAERSDEVVVDGDSSNGNKLDILRISNKSTGNSNSPVLTIIDSEKIEYSATPLLSKTSDDTKYENNIIKAYGNKAFDDHPDDFEDGREFFNNSKKSNKKLIQSWSLELTDVISTNENVKKKMFVKRKSDDLTKLKNTGFF